MDMIKLQTEDYENSTVNDEYWNELKSFQLPQAKSLDDNYSSFMEGLTYWTSMELDKAKKVFRDLYLSADQPDIKQYAALILFNILLSGRDYGEIIDLKLNTSEAIKNDDRELAMAFHQFPTENYVFQSKDNALSMEFSIAGNPIIEASINGLTKKLWLDTGAQISVISASTAAECGVQDNLDLSITADADVTDFNVNARPAYIKSLALGNLIIENHPLMIMNDEMLRIQNPKTKEIIIIDGIVGWNAIQNIDIYIDYKNKTVRMKKPVKKYANANNMFVAGRAILKLTALDNKPVYLGIDTGASQSSISEKATVGIPSQNIVKKLINVGSVGGTKQLETSYITELALFMKDGKKLIFENIRMGADHNEWAVFFRLDGFVGSDLVRNTCLHIDSLNGMVEIID